MIGVFWNVKRRVGSAKLVGLLAKRHRADVVIVAEAGETDATFAAELSARTGNRYATDNRSPHLKLFHRLARWHPIYDGDGLAIRGVRESGGIDALLVAAHLPSKLRFSDADQAQLCPVYLAEIRRAEGLAGHKNTIVVGDLNMNPFDPGMAGIAGFNAAPTRRAVRPAGRVVQGRTYDQFYSPMWSVLGDADATPPGTWYGRVSAPVSYYWHALDQVLVRPDLLERFPVPGVFVETIAGRTRLITSAGHPSWSDHLPLVFSLDLATTNPPARRRRWPKRRRAIFPI